MHGATHVYMWPSADFNQCELIYYTHKIKDMQVFVYLSHKEMLSYNCNIKFVEIDVSQTVKVIFRIFFDFVQNLIGQEVEGAQWLDVQGEVFQQNVC